MKNIGFTFFFMIYVMKLTYSANISKSDRECIEKIHKAFNYTGTSSYKRYFIPRHAFKGALYSTLAVEGEEENVAQRFFNHMHKIVRAKAGTPTLREWCEKPYEGIMNNDQVFADIKNCVDELKKYFSDLTDATQTLKDAFEKLTEKSFEEGDYLAPIYFGVLDLALRSSFEEDFMTPTEFCQNKTKAREIKQYIKKSRKPESDDELESYSFKNQRTDSSSNINDDRTVQYFF